MSNETPLVGIILGSKSDLPAMEGCTEMLEKFGVPYELVVHSAHRNPEQVAAWAKSAEERGLKVIIGAAGKAAALAGVVAAHTPLPVVAVPMKTSDLGGMDSLLSTVQMPTGVPLACVAINGTKNAAILATQILSVGMPAYREVICAYKQELAEA
ncbi:MAG: 5-(carboxyamino)imidazole ribonucleotide mutase [Coriobacteriales bacterium]